MRSDLSRRHRPFRRARKALLGRRFEARVRSEQGDTLVEILMTLVVIGLTTVAVLGAFVTSISTTTEQRTLATSDAVLRSFVESATYQITLATSPSLRAVRHPRARTTPSPVTIRSLAATR